MVQLNGFQLKLSFLLREMNHVSIVYLSDITDEKKVQSRVRDLYEEELAYFTELSSVGGTLQGRMNVTKKYY